MRSSTFLLAGVVGMAYALPVQQEAKRRLNIARDPGVNVDLGGASLTIKKREAEAQPDPAVNIDLGSAGLTIKKREANAHTEPGVNVDLGGANLSLKKRGSESGLNVDQLGKLGELLGGVVDSLPVDASVDAPVLPKREPGVDVDLGGASLSLKKREANAHAEPSVDFDFGGANLTVKKRGDGSGLSVEQLGQLGELLSGLVNSLPVDASVDAPVLPKREPGVDVDLGGANLTIKKRGDGSSLSVEQLGQLGELLSGLINSLPVDASVDAPVLPRADHTEPIIQFS
jgi:sorbitol-specific phosphotransferase system component IIA